MRENLYKFTDFGILGWMKNMIKNISHGKYFGEYREYWEKMCGLSDEKKSKLADIAGGSGVLQAILLWGIGLHLGFCLANQSGLVFQILGWGMIIGCFIAVLSALSIGACGL